MTNLMCLFKKIMGNDSNKRELVEAKRKEAHYIKNQITTDSLKKQKEIDTINVKTYKKLEKISNDLASVTYAIGISTGARDRGLR